MEKNSSFKLGDFFRGDIVASILYFGGIITVIAGGIIDVHQCPAIFALCFILGEALWMYVGDIPILKWLSQPWVRPDSKEKWIAGTVREYREELDKDDRRRVIYLGVILPGVGIILVIIASYEQLLIQTVVSLGMFCSEIGWTRNKKRREWINKKTKWAFEPPFPFVESSKQDL